MIEVKVVSRPYHPKIAVKQEERVEKILLGPEFAFAGDKFAWVFAGQENIMAMYQDSRPQSRKYVQIFADHVAASTNAMARINEQDIVGPKFVELLQRQFFYRHLQKTDVRKIIEIRWRVRLNCSNLTSLTAFGLVCERRTGHQPG